MKACEATPAELLALRDRIQNKEYRAARRECASIQQDEYFALGRPDAPKLPGTDNQDLFINMMDKRSQRAVWDIQNENLILTCARRRESPAAPPAKESVREEESYALRGAFVLGMVCGAILSVLGLFLGILM